jgi:hypothetical protein
MPGLDPGIHQLFKKMDCRVKPGNDEHEINWGRHPVARSAAQLRRWLARLEGWATVQVSHPSRLAEDGEHLRMTVR